MTQELFDAMRQSVIDGDATAAGKLAEQALAEGIDPLVAIDEAFVPGIRHVGEQFRCGDLFLPDMMLAARAMQTATSYAWARVIEERLLPLSRRGAPA